ncbi:MAG TPA: cytochrome c biogenesis protein ResB [Candidatus Brocadiia bacterium]|nr:cytochrome c biogenesis protein ResB [Planctomycetota bacterium]MDO8092565.1 cytochrome c biogenesis protein ResB [Candidatus Brocadiales bacterium]
MENEKEIIITKKHNVLYRVFISTKTSVILFGCLLIFFLIGSILPYHGDYNNITVKGFLFKVIKALDLLNVYSGPWFLTAAALFLANISVCSYHRLRCIIRGHRPKTLSVRSISAHRDVLRFSFSAPVDDVVNKLHHFFRPRLFRRIPVKTKDENTIGGFYEKGILHPNYLSLIFHFSVVLILVGCVITFLFAFEGEVTIFDDKPVEIATISDKTTWHKLFGGKQSASGGFVVPDNEKFEVGLKKFETKYTYRPRVKNFPMKGFAQRTKEIVKQANLTLYSKEDSYYPIEYSSQLKICDPSTTSPQKCWDVFTKVNLPLRYRGITFYQSAYDYRFDLLANGEKVEISEEGKFKLPGIDGEFEKGEIVSGKFVERDDSISPIQPFVKVGYTPSDKDENALKETFKLLEGIEQDIKGANVKVENFRAGTVLSYRHDPGLKPLWVGAPILFFAMLFRAWGCWYRVSYVVEKTAVGAGFKPAPTNLYLHIHRTGIWGNEEGILRKLERALGSSYGAGKRAEDSETIYPVGRPL